MAIFPTFDPAAPEAEQTAWAAGLNLHNPPPDFDTALPDGTTPRGLATETYRKYYEHRKAQNLPLFPKLAAQARETEQAEFKKAFQGLEHLQTNLRPDQWSVLDAAATGETDPDEFRARAVNASWLKSLVGRDIPPEHLSSVRDAYAVQVLGLKDDTSDKAVYAAIQKRFQEDDVASDTLGKITQKLYMDTLTGKLPENPSGTLETLPVRLRTDAQAQIQTSVREARRMKRKLSPLVDGFVNGIQTMAAKGTDEQGRRVGGFENFVQIVDQLPVNREERNLALAMLASRLKAMPKQDPGYFERFLQAGERSTRLALRRFGDLATADITAATAAMAEAVAGEEGLQSEEVSIARQASQINEDRAQLQRLYYSDGDPLERATDGLVKKSLLLGVQSAWTLPASLTGPAGFAFMATSMGGSSYMDARQMNPEADPNAQLLAANVSGVAQGLVETGVNKLGFKAITGKLPGLAGIMNRMGVASKLGRAAVGGTLSGLEVGISEYAEEAAQGAIDRGLQDLALEFSNIAPDTDWKQFWTDWATVGGQEQKDTLLAVMPFALIGAGGASFSHFKYGKSLSQNKQLLRAVGVPEVKIQEITRSTDIAAADRAMQEAFQGGLEDRTAEQRSAALEVLREQNAILQKAGLPRITTETNSFTDQTAYVFTDPITAAREEFETEDAALEHWRNFALHTSEAEVDRISEAARLGSVEFLTGEGMASEGTRVEEQAVTMTPERALQAGIITKEQLQSRIELFVMQEGLTPEQAAKEVGGLTIKARRYSEQARDGQFRYTVQLFRGANVMDVFEDLSEDSFARALDDGFADGEILLNDVRRFEDATGQTLLPSSYDYDSANRMPLLEALSKLSRAHLLGNVRANTLPPEVAKWVELNTTIYSQTLAGAQNIASDINRAGVLKEAIARGEVSPRLERLIADSIGINSDALERRLTKRMEDQLAAEAMGGFPEIGEVAKGLLPHPDTMQAKHHPLAGEVRRLWESMKKATRRKTKDEKAIDRTNEANAFFLPVGDFVDLDQVRQSINQKGFDFDTPADLLDALDTSLSYGKPVYGVNSGDESFALSPSSINRLEAAIAKKLTQGPDERAEFYERLRHRLASLTQRLEDMDAGIGPFARKETDPAGEERRRIQDAIAEARTVIDTLPVEARGRVNLDFADITNATTERGRVNALVRLIDKADAALENVLQKEYMESFERLLDLAKPTLLGNKQLRGRLTPETQRMVQKVSDTVTLTAVEAAGKMVAQQAAIDALEDKVPSSPEEATAMQKELIELYIDQQILETFSTLSSRSASELAHAHQQLLSIYTRGRTTRQIVDEQKRQEMQTAKREVLDSLPRVDQATHSKRTADKGLMDWLEGGRLGLSSFHQVMEHLFPKSQTARMMQSEIRKADRTFVRAKIDARERFEEFMRAAFGLEGRSARRKGNKILAKLSTRRDDWNIQLKEGIKFETEKMSEEQAAAILDGTLKPGWESDPIAMESLRQALADFRLQRLKAKNDEKAFTSKVIRFQRLTSRGAPAWLHLSDLEAVYFLQLAAQDQYLPALDKYGFTAQVLDSIRSKIDPAAVKLGTFLRREYDSEYARLNPVFRNLYGLDMPRIRNYAPGIFDHLDGKSDSNAMDAYGNPATPVNAMSSGFTKSRTHHMARPRQINAMGAFWSHLEATEYFIAYAETVRDMRQIFRNPDVRRAIEGNYGSRAAQTFSTWLDAIEVDGRFRAASMATMSEMTASVLGTQSAVGLAFNLGVLFKQVSAVTGVMMEMGTTSAIKGLMRTLADPASLKHIWNTESIQQRIKAGMNPEDKRMLDAANASPSMIMDLLEVGRMPIAWADAAFTTISGTLAYQHAKAEALKNGLPDSHAETVALDAMDRVVTRTAQPATTQDKSLAEVTATGFTRALFMFKSDPRQKLAIAAASVMDFKKGRIGAGELTNRLFWSWAVYGILAELMTDIWAGISKDDDDEERWAVSDYAAAMIAGPIAGIPLLGAGIDHMIGKGIGTGGFSNTANPIDAATASVAKMLSDGGPATWKELVADKPFDLTDLLTAAQRDSSAFALIAGAKDPRFAIIPAALRAAKDVAGVLGNASELVFGESQTDQARKIIEDERKTDRETKDQRTAEVGQHVKELAPLTPEARAARLRPLDADLRKKVETKLKQKSMSSVERSLSNLSKDARARAIGKITAGMTASEKNAYQQRLKSLGID